MSWTPIVGKIPIRNATAFSSAYGRSAGTFENANTWSTPATSTSTVTMRTTPPRKAPGRRSFWK
jgi:hypothetical protein